MIPLPRDLTGLCLQNIEPVALWTLYQQSTNWAVFPGPVLSAFLYAKCQNICSLGKDYIHNLYAQTYSSLARSWPQINAKLSQVYIEKLLWGWKCVAGAGEEQESEGEGNSGRCCPNKHILLDVFDVLDVCGWRKSHCSSQHWGQFSVLLTVQWKPKSNLFLTCGRDFLFFTMIFTSLHKETKTIQSPKYSWWFFSSSFLFLLKPCPCFMSQTWTESLCFRYRFT